MSQESSYNADTEKAIRNFYPDRRVKLTKTTLNTPIDLGDEEPPKKVSSIQESFVLHEKAIALLAEYVQILLDRLNPVLKPDDSEQEVSNTVPSSRSPMHTTLGVMSDSLSNLSMKIDFALQRMEL